jgi:hypothetical protein
MEITSTRSLHTRRLHRVHQGYIEYKVEYILNYANCQPRSPKRPEAMLIKYNQSLQSENVIMEISNNKTIKIICNQLGRYF